MRFFWILLSFRSCVALRTSQVSALVSGSEQKYTVQLTLTLTEPRAKAGKSIEIAVDGARRMSRTHSTKTGEPVVLHHMTKGAVVTAHVGAWAACAYWVGPKLKHCTVGEWELAFTTIEENEQGLVSAALHEAYVKVVGWGPNVTIEVDHVPVYSFDSVAPNETFVHPGLKKGVLVKAVSESRDTCTHRVGSEETMCDLDNTWGLLLGDVVVFGEDNDDEGATDTTTDNKRYTVAFSLQRDNAAARRLDIGFDGHLLASKLEATELGEAIVVHHVKSGSVFTAVAHEFEEACCMYVGAGIGVQTATCAGWTLLLNIHEETDNSFKHHEMMFDVGYSVHRASTGTTGTWGFMANNEAQIRSTEPMLFPGDLGGWLRGTEIVPFVDNVLDVDCTHVVGGHETSCEYKGWTFTMTSKLNMNKPGNATNWDYDHMDIGDEDPEFYEIRVTATDATSSTHSTLECIAREDLELYSVPLGENKKNILKNEPLFRTKNLTSTATNSSIPLKTATFIGQFPAGSYLDEGFACTLYREESIMCEADTDGGQWTNQPGFTLEIDVDWQ